MGHSSITITLDRYEAQVAAIEPVIAAIERQIALGGCVTP